jgi:hypothetical protein
MGQNDTERNEVLTFFRRDGLAEISVKYYYSLSTALSQSDVQFQFAQFEQYLNDGIF